MEDRVPVTMQRENQIGRLERVSPREVWQHEAHHFTPWLAANADRLAEALGIDLEVTGTELPVGGFSLDIVGMDITHNKPLIVENQLEGSDHGHLGQLLTYTAGTGAATIVWIATQIRDEHRQALTWLNEHTDPEIHFFGVELEVVKIGTSSPAPLFNVVVMPNDWQKIVKAATASAGGARAAMYASFWNQYLARIQAERPTWSRARHAPQQNWFPMSVGVPSGCTITASFGVGDKLRHELYIGRATTAECKALFDHLVAQREMFEGAYGRPLSWERLDHRKASRIADYRPGVVENTDEHQGYVDWLLDCGDRLRRAIAAADINVETAA